MDKLIWGFELIQIQSTLNFLLIVLILSVIKMDKMSFNLLWRISNINFVSSFFSLQLYYVFLTLFPTRIPKCVWFLVACLGFVRVCRWDLCFFQKAKKKKIITVCLLNMNEFFSDSTFMSPICKSKKKKLA